MSRADPHEQAIARLRRQLLHRPDFGVLRHIEAEPMHQHRERDHRFLKCEGGTDAGARPGTEGQVLEAVYAGRGFPAGSARA